MIKRFWTEYPAVGQSFNLKLPGLVKGVSDLAMIPHKLR
jgi:hypothetical protein